MSNATLFPVPKPQFFDNNGVVLAGGKLYFYEPGTVTPKDVYSTSNMASALTNPVILDSAGRAEIWLDGFYDVILKDANDTQLYSANNVSSAGGNQSSSSVTDQWIARTEVPTYIGANQFSVPTDLTSIYSIGRRVKAVVTAGTIYGTITGSNYANSVTTLTNLWDLTTLDSGLANVYVGLPTASNTSIPIQIPVGGIIWWHKSLTGTPALPWGWVECNGQTLSDAESPLNGQTIPDINGQGRFIRGSNVSGTTQANQNLEHTHTANIVCFGTNAYGFSDSNASNDIPFGNASGVLSPLTANIANSGSTESRPDNISMVAIMRVK